MSCPCFNFALLVVYRRETYGDGPADWCEEFWTGDRGRMCLAHARYAGSNNNMGVEVSWRLIKEICSFLSSLSQFIGALCKFIRTQLGEEHMERMGNDGHYNYFIREPQPKRKCMTLCGTCIPRPSARALSFQPLPASATPRSYTVT